MTKKITCALLAATLLSACGGSASQTTNASASTKVERPRTCESIRPEVIRIASGNGVNIVKIYDPKTIGSGPKKVTCSGRALLSGGQEALFYYRNYQDADGDWLVEYNDNKMD